MDRKLFFVTFGVAFIIGLAVGLVLACSTVASAVHPNTVTSKAWEEVEESKLGNSSQATEAKTHFVTIGGIVRELNDEQVTQLAQAFANISWSYYHFKDYEEYDWDHFKKVRPYTFWDDCISETFDYDIIDEILNSDWGDFYDVVEGEE